MNARCRISQSHARVAHWTPRRMPDGRIRTSRPDPSKRPARRPSTALSPLTLLCCLFVTASASAFDHAPRDYPVLRLKSGLVLPYPLDNLFRGFGRCKRGRHTHRALDLGGVGPRWGLGTPVRSMTDGKVLIIGTPITDPKRHGRPDTRDGHVQRGKYTLPSRIEVAGYGPVYPFTENYGRLRTGGLVVIRAKGSRLDKYKVKYMHLAAVHPALRVGQTVQAGQELGLLGGTAVQQDPPHLHLAVENTQGTEIDVARLFGLGSSAVPCSRPKRERMAGRVRLRRSALKLMKTLLRQVRRAPKVATLALTADGAVYDGALDPRAVDAQLVALPPFEADLVVTLQPIEAGFKPRLRLLDPYRKPLHNGYGRKSVRGGIRSERLRSGRRKPHVARMSLRAKKAPRAALLHVGWWGRRPKVPVHYRLSVRPAQSSNGATAP